MINRITFIFSLLIFNTLYSQVTFGYETAVDNGNNLTETINGITLTTSIIDIEIADFGESYGSSGNVAASFRPNTSAQFTFSEPVNITSILALENNGTNTDYTFTPTGGSNSPVTVSLINGVYSVNLNWSNINSFVVTNGQGGTPLFAFDNVVITTTTLSTISFEEVKVTIYPNPSNDYIQITGLTGNEKYTLYNILGTEIKKGFISNNEQIDIRDFTNGLYFLKFDNGNTMKFIKG
ncbi:T9SS type A sorting domain-containing protein [Corallibacter sp.]|uniref:T9SS type A sorting domain-containing protein n=1 Tax=Corallibacter sp. TaxID=2038084 RepID=UPI003A918228